MNTNCPKHQSRSPEDNIAVYIRRSWLPNVPLACCPLCARELLLSPRESKGHSPYMVDYKFDENDGLRLYTQMELKQLNFTRVDNSLLLNKGKGTIQ